MKTVSYSSTRREVWRHYWRAWARPTGLWMIHTLLGLLFAVGRSGAATTSVSAFFTHWLLGTAVCVLVVPLFPLVLFKPQRRLLTIDEVGWTTEIGNRRGSRAWSKIQAIQDDGDVIAIIGVNKNAMIIPRRAFSSDTERRDFLESAQSWHASAAAR